MSFNFSDISVEEKKKESKIGETTSLVSSFTFNHLAANWSITLGTYLRRVLLDCVGGIALWGVKISDREGPVKTKFSSLVGVDKAAFFLVTALKEIIFEEDKEQPLLEKPLSFSDLFSFSLKKKSEEEEIVIKAGDFVKTEEGTRVKIRNPELILATLSPNSFLEMILYCRKGFGYLVERKQESVSSRVSEDFIIVLDSNYSPIKNVFPREEIIVTSLVDKEERLTLDIETNGSITPKKALEEALNIVINVWDTLDKKVRLERDDALEKK